MFHLKWFSEKFLLSSTQRTSCQSAYFQRSFYLVKSFLKHIKNGVRKSTEKSLFNSLFSVFHEEHGRHSDSLDVIIWGRGHHTHESWDTCTHAFHDLPWPSFDPDRWPGGGADMHQRPADPTRMIKEESNIHTRKRRRKHWLHLFNGGRKCLDPEEKRSRKFTQLHKNITRLSDHSLTAGISDFFCSPAGTCRTRLSRDGRKPQQLICWRRGHMISDTSLAAPGLHVGVPARPPVRLGGLQPIRGLQDAASHDDDVRASPANHVLRGGVLLA